MAGPATKYLLREHKLRRAHNFISGDMRGSLKGLASDCANIAKLPELVRQRYCGQLQFSNSRLVQYIQVKACCSALAARSSAVSGTKSPTQGSASIFHCFV